MKKPILTFLALLPLICFGQANAEMIGTPLGGFVMFLLGLTVFLIIFLALRQVVLWYWKVETLLKNQNEQTRILTSIYNSIEENNRLTQSQIELVIGKEPDIL